MADAIDVAFWGGASAEGPTFSENEWDIVTIGGTPMPGICEVKGISQLEVDKKKAKGAHGSTITITGYQPGPFEVACTIWTKDQWSWMQEVIDLVWNEPLRERPVTRTGRPPVVAFDIDHPALQAVKISSCVVVGITFAETAHFDGGRVVRFKCFEHRNTGKQSATKTAKGSANRVQRAQELRTPTKNETPPKPSTDKKQLGPNGPPPAKGGGSD